jgi:hypothetical protein
MEKKSPRDTAILPPPVSTILLYAADGLSSFRRHLSSTGRPRPPSRSDWIPKFYLLMQTDMGLLILRVLAEEGMRAWNCPPIMLECLDAAVRDITFRAMSIAALRHFADMARDKVILPASMAPVNGVQQQPPPEKPRPRPGSLHPEGPHRPTGRWRPNGGGPRPCFG